MYATTKKRQSKHLLPSAELQANQHIARYRQINQATSNAVPHPPKLVLMLLMLMLLTINTMETVPSQAPPWYEAKIYIVMY